jgi:hypothetical protein
MAEAQMQLDENAAMNEQDMQDDGFDPNAPTPLAQLQVRTPGDANTWARRRYQLEHGLQLADPNLIMA